MPFPTNAILFFFLGLIPTEHIICLFSFCLSHHNPSLHTQICTLFLPKSSPMIIHILTLTIMIQYIIPCLSPWMCVFMGTGQGFVGAGECIFNA